MSAEPYDRLLRPLGRGQTAAGVLIALAASALVTWLATRQALLR